MSPRAAWRLEAAGFGPVHDHAAGKTDWSAADLPSCCQAPEQHLPLRIGQVSTAGHEYGRHEVSGAMVVAERCGPARVLARREQHSHRREREVLDMRRLRPSSEAEMVALFLRTELPAARFRDTLQALMDQAGWPESLVTAPNLDDPAENQAREQLLTAHRGYGTRTGLFDGFPHDVRWEWMAITPAKLATVRYIDYDYWVELSGGTRLAADAAPRIRAGVAPFGVSSDWALGMAQAVADGTRFPPLILVTTGASGNLVVLEGHARLTAYMLRPDRLPPELEVLVGSSPGMAD